MRKIILVGDNGDRVEYTNFEVVEIRDRDASKAAGVLGCDGVKYRYEFRVIGDDTVVSGLIPATGKP